MLQEMLQKIGLTDKDALVYLSCLELGTQPASVIAKKAGLKRPTTYLILEGLLKKGLVSEYTGANVKYFTAVSPEYLMNFMEKQKREIMSRQREFEEYLPQFQALLNPFSVNPKVRFYEGIDGIERAMNDTLTAKEPLRCFSTFDAWFSRQETKDFVFQYMKRRLDEKALPIRCVCPRTQAAERFLTTEFLELRRAERISEFRWLPKEIQNFSNEINIYDNKVAIACLGKNELMGIIIESESIAMTQKSVFEAVWMSAKPVTMYDKGDGTTRRQTRKIAS